MAKDILQIFEPTMKLDVLSQIEFGAGLDDSERSLGGKNQISAVGILYPLVKINNQPLNQNMIKFSLDLNGKIPKIFITYSPPPTGVFVSSSYPKDGDIASLYLSSGLQDYKPIRADFLITSIESMPSSFIHSSDAGFGEHQIFNISGEMRIPKLYTPFSASFGKSASIDVLKKIAKELDLGFCTNIGSTEDIMNWISPYDTYYDFIDNIVNSSWINENTAFDWWIDIYYNLNFVNIIEQVNLPYNIYKIKIFPNSDLGNNDVSFYQQEAGVQTVDLILSNDRTLTNQPVHIDGFTLISNAGEINLDSGYNQILQFFDPWDSNDNFVSWNIEAPFKPIEKTHSIGMRGRFGEELYKKEDRYNYIGISNLNPADNNSIHVNYYHSKVQNPFYRSQLNKFILRIEIDSMILFSLYKGMNIPIHIYSAPNSSGQRLAIIQYDEYIKNPGSGSVFDKFLSGNYMILGYEVIWTAKNKYQYIMDLVKSEWVVNSGVTSYTLPISIQDPKIKTNS